MSQRWVGLISHGRSADEDLDAHLIVSVKENRTEDTVRRSYDE
jgi:hypothetical protein